jgi:hypothetical protein
MNRRGDPERADRLRAVPLTAVLRLCGAQPDRYDRRKWQTARGALSVTGAKFMNWTQGVGGGGAIDLIMHLRGGGFQAALQWLEHHFPGSLSAPDPLPASRGQAGPSPREPDFRLPPPQPRHLERVKRCLNVQRALPMDLIDSLIGSGVLYADHRANAVFPLLGKGNEPVGAELRGTGPMAWRGMVPGSRKDLGFFSVPVLAPPSPPVSSPAGIILCESAIDAISCFVLHSADYRCISTAGARPDPGWLPGLILTGIPVFCGFDADPAGDTMAQRMIARHPSIQRLRPSHHDWNDLLQSLR